MTNENLLNQITSWAEPYHMDYLDMLKTINQIVLQKQVVLSDNIFYSSVSELSDHPDHHLRNCRRIFALFANSCEQILEQGFDAGYNAMLALTANDKLRYISTDVVATGFSQDCFVCLKQKFGSRLEYHTGPGVTNNLVLSDKKTGFVINGSYNEQMVKHVETVLRWGRSGDLVIFNNLLTPEQSYVVCWAQMQASLVPMFYNADKQMVFFIK